MMPMPMGRKAPRIEKVEKLSRGATAQAILPTRGNKSHHACAIRWTNFLQPGAALFERRAGGADVDRCRSALPLRSISTCETAIQPAVAALPDMSHFAAEFYEYCANPAAPL
jgi:hypothetical protein